MLKQLVIVAFLLATLGIAASVTVRSGDTLGSLAVRYNTTVATLMKINRLSTPKLAVGQQLRLPDNATVTVQTGDTLEGIAGRLGLSTTALQRANNLQSDALRVNQTLRLPSSNSATNTSASSANTVGSSSSRTTAVDKTVTYTVKAGDRKSVV